MNASQRSSPFVAIRCNVRGAAGQNADAITRCRKQKSALHFKWRLCFALD